METKTNQLYQHDIIFYKRENNQVTPIFLIKTADFIKNNIGFFDEKNDATQFDFEYKKAGGIIEAYNESFKDKKGFKINGWMIVFKKNNISGNYITNLKYYYANRFILQKVILIDITECEIEYIKNYCYASNYFIKCMSDAYIIHFKEFYIAKLLNCKYTLLKPEFKKIKMFYDITGFKVNPCHNLYVSSYNPDQVYRSTYDLFKTIQSFSVKSLEEALKTKTA